ncbi:beta-secretase isoform X2 [Rhipicephalus sanguineus]|uniref:beta-secretase isoform X2 n=1 Tax=Rhipicephalus sanguineus TaxID=34632 RepID=UPI0020C57D09|nr:beta-secretase isoform X2 [Rhipicephalus sanguineus]
MLLDFQLVALTVLLLVSETLSSAADSDGIITFPVRPAVRPTNFTSIEGNAIEGAAAEGFIAKVYLGTPPQRINLYVDTGSSDIAVAASDDNNLTTYFFTNRSATYVSGTEDVSKRFVTGGYNGTVGSDILRDMTSLSLKVPLIAIASSVDMFPPNARRQGLWGLAFPHLTRQQSFMEALSAEKGITHFVLSYCDKHEMGSAQNFGALLNDDPAIVDTGATNLLLPDDVFHWVFDMLNEQGKYNLSSDITTVYCLEDGFVVNDFPMLEVLMPDAQGNIFTLKIPPSVYFQEVTLKRGDHGCYKLAVAQSPSGIMIGFTIIRGLTTVFDLGNKRVGFAPLLCNANDVIVKYAEKDHAGHSCIWELPTMGSKTWTVFIYIIVFICLMCALPVVIVGLLWLRRRIRLCRSRRLSDGVGLINI